MTYLLLITFISLSVILWAWAIYDIYKTRFASSNTQWLMILVVLIAPVIGSIVYFQMKPQLTQQRGKRKFNPFTKN